MYLKKLRIILLYKVIIISLLITLGITYYRIKNETEKAYPNEVTITGIVTNIKKENTKTQIELKSTEKILINYYDDIDINIGDEIKVQGQLEIPPENTVFNLFNYKKYLKSKKINYLITPTTIIKIKSTNQIKYQIKNKIIEYIDSYKSKNYLQTFLLGDNSAISEETIASYKQNGISHLFAVSGMHLSLFSVILIFILKKIKIKENIIFIIISITFIFFAFLTNYTPSILRALLMYIFLNINKILNLKIKSIYILIITFEILVLYNPFYLYHIGFQFSYTVSFFLILFNNIINNQKGYIKKTLITSLIAWLSSIPISINNFFEINPLAPLINIIFIPFISFIIFPMSLITILIKPLDNIFLFLTTILETISLNITHINITIPLAHIPWYVTIIYYLLIIIFIKGINTKQIKNFLPLLFAIIIHLNIKNIIPSEALTIIDVGQGDSALLELKNNKNILIDTGGNIYNPNTITNNRIIPYLKSLGIKKLDYLIITHGDFDHMGESLNIVNNFPIDQVILNNDAYNELEQSLIKNLNNKNIKYYNNVETLNIDNNKLYFLNTKQYDNENDNSNVIYLNYNNYKILLMGDAGVDKEKDIIEKYQLSDIDFIKIGHHGSDTSSSKNFIDKINPKYSLISVGKNNRYGHPKTSVLDILSKTKIFRTDIDGSIKITLNKKGYKIKTSSQSSTP